MSFYHHRHSLVDPQGASRSPGMQRSATGALRPPHKARQWPSTDVRQMDSRHESSRLQKNTPWDNPCKSPLQGHTRPPWGGKGFPEGCARPPAEHALAVSASPGRSNSRAAAQALGVGCASVSSDAPTPPSGPGSALFPRAGRSMGCGCRCSSYNHPTS